ncbi:MAG: hypothetical protein OSB58_02395 [Alphaproteobacteria bacterium]|nr:hypothetical protein [Alphaproteobacteria bacterium]
MPDIRYQGFPAVPGTLDTFIEREIGYRMVADGEEWRIPEDDPVLIAGPSDVLRMHQQIRVADRDYGDVANELIATIPTDFNFYTRGARPDLPDNIEIDGNFGLFSDLYSASTEAMFNEGQGLVDCLRERFLPILVERMGIKYVVPVSVDANYLQTHLWITRLMLLAREFGFDQMRQFARPENGQGSFAAIEINPLSVLSYLESVTRFSPMAFTLPIRRLGIAWHFQGDGFYAASNLGARSFYSSFYEPLRPRTTEISSPLFSGMGTMNEANIWRMLREAVDGINRIVKFLIDPRNFQEPDGVVDVAKQLQTRSAMHMLFADLLTVNTASEIHIRMSFAFSYLDKMANLRKHLGGGGDEDRLARSLPSLSQGKELKRLYRARIRERRPELIDALVPIIGRCFAGLHRRLGNECGQGKKQEFHRLRRLRQLRNLTHGTFLRNEGFEELFLESPGSVPDEFMTLPFLLTWGLMCDPEAFLQFRPTIRI